MTAMIPYGRLSGGNYGVKVDELTGTPLASLVEVLPVLPAVASTDNFPGRLVFDLTTTTVYVYKDIPPMWTPLDGVPARIVAVGGNPPIVPPPPAGDMVYDTDTSVLFLFDGTQWVGVGGRYAATIVANRFVGDGVTVSFPMGVNIPVPVEYVEVYWDGVRQYPNPSGDFNIVGVNVVFTNPPPSNVDVYIRTLVSDPLALSPNTQITKTVSTASPAQTTFPTGQAGSSPDSVFVYVDGVLRTDYTLSQQDTTITSIVKSAPTVALATTATSHSLGVGSVKTIGGVSESEYSGTITVTNVPAVNLFEYTIVITAPASATPDPIMYFSPPQINDDVVFTNPLVGGETVEIRVLKNVVVAPSTGEDNAGINIGTGVGVYASKSGKDLQFKSMLAGNNVIIQDAGSEVMIHSTSGATSESRSGINTFYYVLAPTDSYVGVRDTTSPVTIDLNSVINDPSESGRRVVVTDESGGAAINNISIISAGSLFSGQPSPYVLSTNYGSVTLVKDGTNWYITSKI